MAAANPTEYAGRFQADQPDDWPVGRAACNKTHNNKKKNQINKRRMCKSSEPGTIGYPKKSQPHTAIMNFLLELFFTLG